MAAWRAQIRSKNLSKMIWLNFLYLIGYLATLKMIIVGAAVEFAWVHA
jgi:hypothetical protein